MRVFSVMYMLTTAGWLLSECWKCGFNVIWRVWFVASSWLHACPEEMGEATL